MSSAKSVSRHYFQIKRKCMVIDGKVHCFFEQSGTFKNEFIKLGILAEDYDIQNNFNQTDHVIDLFAEIENAYDGKESIFDKITPPIWLSLSSHVYISVLQAKWLSVSDIQTIAN